MKLATGAYVLVCDGQKYLLLENKGDEDLINLQVLEHETLDRAQLQSEGLERPGQFTVSGTRRGSGDMTPVYELAESRFALTIAGKVNDHAVENHYRELLIIADKTTLGILRQTLSDQVLERVTGEIGNDITHDTIPEIEAFILAA